MGFLLNWLFGKDKNNKTQENNSNNDSIIPSEEDIDEFEMLEEIFDDE